MSLRAVPPKQHPTHTPSAISAPSAPGIHDTLRTNLGLNNPAPVAKDAPVAPASTHPLEARLLQWRATQDALKMEGLRRTFGMGEPIRRGMELKIANAGEWKPMALGGAEGIHADILNGRDCEIGWEDVFKGDELREIPDFHTEMEGRLRMNW